MKLNLLGGAYEGVSKDANPQRCVNLYLEPDHTGGKPALVGMPGLVQKAQVTQDYDALCESQNTVFGGMSLNGDHASSTFPEGVYVTVTTTDNDAFGFAVVGTALDDSAANETIISADTTTVTGTVLFKTITSITTPIASTGTVTVGVDLAAQRGTEIRGFHVMGALLYVVYGNACLSLDTSDSVSLVSTSALNTFSGPVVMADNGSQLMITDGTTEGYLYDSTDSSWTRLDETSNDFLGGGSVTYQAGRFITHRVGTHTFYYSTPRVEFPAATAQGGGLEWDALDRETSTNIAGNVVCVISTGSDLWVFKADSFDVFYNHTEAQPFRARPSTAHKVGCQAANSAVLLDNAVFWLANDLTVRRSESYYNPAIITPPQIVEQFRSYAVTSDAIAFGYLQGGKTFYQITFPTAGKTWVYEVSAKLWYERGSYTDGASDFDGRHRANCCARFNDQVLVGDFSSGYVYVLDPDTYTDDGQRIIRTRVAQTVSDDDQARWFIDSIQVHFEHGVGLTSGQGSNPMAMMRLSKDGGHSWGVERWRSIGRTGEFGTRAIWRRLGRARRLTVEVSVSDPVRVVILGASVQANKGDS